jgi:hypothetical protein
VAQRVGPRARVEQPVADERHDRVDLLLGQVLRRRDERVEARENGSDGGDRAGEVDVQALSNGVVLQGRGDDVEVMLIAASRLVKAPSCMNAGCSATFRSGEVRNA